MPQSKYEVQDVGFFLFTAQHKIKSAPDYRFYRNFKRIFLSLLTGWLVPTIVFKLCLKKIHFG